MRVHSAALHRQGATGELGQGRRAALHGTAGAGMPACDAWGLGWRGDAAAIEGGRINDHGVTVAEKGIGWASKLDGRSKAGGLGLTGAWRLFDARVWVAARYGKGTEGGRNGGASGCDFAPRCRGLPRRCAHATNLTAAWERVWPSKGRLGVCDKPPFLPHITHLYLAMKAGICVKESG